MNHASPDTPAPDDDIAASRDRRYFTELMLAIEDRFDVNAMRHEDLHLWPVVRWELGRGMKDAGDGDEPAATPAAAPRPAAAPAENRGGGLLRRLYRRLRGRAGAARPAVDAARPRAGRESDAALAARHAEQLDRLREHAPLDFAVFAKVEKYYQRVGDRRYAPITDPVYESLLPHGRASMVGVEPLDFECVNPPLRIDFRPHMKLSAAWPRPACPRLGAQIEALNRLLAELAPGFSVSEERVLHRLARYVRKRAFFEDVVRALAPRVVLFSSFVGWSPLTWACRRLGVPTVDIQHGGQSAFHGLTTHYGHVPPDGYALLPDFFWVWSERNRRYIEPWFPGGACRHVPLVGGNRNVAKWERTGSEGLLDADERRYLDALGEAEKVVLVSIGYGVAEEELLPPVVVEAARRTPGWRWLLRMHPIHRSDSSRAAILRSVEQAGLRNAEVDAPTRLRLHALLTRSHHHVTAFSTTCREALAFGVPTTIVDPVGRNYFADELAEGLFAYADTADALLASIEAATPVGDEQAGEWKIQTDDRLVADVVARVTARRPAADEEAQ